jgi:RNA polymerase sigma-70 factor (ECF subfamily)
MVEMEENKQEQFMLLYRPVHEHFERFCKARAYGELDFRDLMHDTLLIAFEKFNRIKTKDAFLYFLFGTAVRVLSNHRRKNTPDFVGDFSEKFSHIESNDKSAEHELEIKELYRQLGKLDSITRECIILFEISGFSIKEIMCIKDLSESAVKQRLSRGRKQLAELMNLVEK